MKLHKIILVATAKCLTSSIPKEPKFSPDLLPGQLITRRRDEMNLLFYIFLICDMFSIDNV